jgi:hypothetical protein
VGQNFTGTAALRNTSQKEKRLMTRSCLLEGLSKMRGDHAFQPITKIITLVARAQPLGTQGVYRNKLNVT